MKKQKDDNMTPILNDHNARPSQGDILYKYLKTLNTVTNFYNPAPKTHQIKRCYITRAQNNPNIKKQNIIL